MLEIAHGPALLKVRIVENLGGVEYTCPTFDIPRG